MPFFVKLSLWTLTTHSQYTSSFSQWISWGLLLFSNRIRVQSGSTDVWSDWAVCCNFLSSRVIMYIMMHCTTNCYNWRWQLRCGSIVTQLTEKRRKLMRNGLFKKSKVIPLQSWQLHWLNLVKIQVYLLEQKSFTEGHKRKMSDGGCVKAEGYTVYIYWHVVHILVWTTQCESTTVCFRWQKYSDKMQSRWHQ